MSGEGNEEVGDGEPTTSDGMELDSPGGADGTVRLAEALGDGHPAFDGEVDPEIRVRDHPTVIETVSDTLTHFAEADLDEGFAGPPTDEFVATRFFDFDYLDGVKEVERQWVREPFAYVSVLYDDAESTYRYHVTEPTLDGFERYVREDLIELLRNNLMYRDLEQEGDRVAVFREEVKRLIDDHAATIDDGSLHKLLYYLMRDFIHFGPIDPIMQDGAIEDVSCDGSGVPVYVYHREYRDLRSNVVLAGQELDSFTFRLAQRAGKPLTVSDPLVDASLPDGSRVQLTLGGDISARGSNFTIRKFADVPFTPVDLIGWNTFSVEQMAYFWLAIENNKSLIFAGGTGSGKTSSMNAVSFFIPPSSKVVSIEDTREIDLLHENWIQSVTREGTTAGGRGEVTMYRLLQAALRQRPEYLLVGEIRTEERVALTFFQAMSTGHTAYTTVHADSVETVLSRLRNPPLNVPAQMLQDLDIVSIQRQTFIGDRRVRRNEAIAEVSRGKTPEEIDTRTVFRRDAATDTHEQVGDSVVLDEIATDRGWDADELQRELEERETVLRYLREADITGFEAVSRAIERYQRDRASLMERIRADDLTEADLDGSTPAVEDVSPEDLDVANLTEGL